MTQFARLLHALVAVLFGTFLLAWFLLVDQLPNVFGVAIWCGLVLFGLLHFFFGPKAKTER